MNKTFTEKLTKRVMLNETLSLIHEGTFKSKNLRKIFLKMTKQFRLSI